VAIRAEESASLVADRELEYISNGMVVSFIGCLVAVRSEKYGMMLDTFRLIASIEETFWEGDKGILNHVLHHFVSSFI
jgi:hypothetical protein